MEVDSDSSQGSASEAESPASPAQSDDERSVQSKGEESDAGSRGEESAQYRNEDSDHDQHEDESQGEQSPAQSVEGSPNTQASDGESERAAYSERQTSDGEASENEGQSARSERVEQEDSENEYAASPRSEQGSVRSRGNESDNEQSDLEPTQRRVDSESEEAASADEKERENSDEEADQKSDDEEEERRQSVSSDDEETQRIDSKKQQKAESSPEHESHSEAEEKESNPESDDQRQSDAEENAMSGAESDEDSKPQRQKRATIPEDSDEEEDDDNRRKRKVSAQDDIFSAEESDNEEESRKRQREESEAGSDDETAPKRKKRTVVDSDEERSHHGSEHAVRSREGSVYDVGREKDEKSDNEENPATVHDLFGEDLSSDEEGHKKQTEADAALQNGHANEMPMDMQDEEVDEPPKETKINVEIPYIAATLGKEINFIKMPNFLSVDTRPFDPTTYEDEIDEEEGLDEEGRARLKLKVENTIRWKEDFDDDGNAIKESNARIVRWSDGSLSLHLGSEIFDVYRQTLIQGDHNHLFVRQGTGLQGQSVFRTKLTFRPHSTDSFTHRKMTLSLADRNQKTQKIRVLPNVGQDPEAHRSEMIKKEEDRLKASIRRESKQRRMKEKSHTRGLNASYLENDNYEDEDGAISLNAIKNRYKKGGAALSKAHIYSSDEDASDDEKAKRLEDAKADDDDDSDLDYFEKKASADGKKKTAAIEESDEET